MSKTIIFCADGTWNGMPPHMENPQLHSAVASDTTSEIQEGIAGCSNVYKLFSCLQGNVIEPSSRKEQEKVQTGQNAQVAKYIHGVGDSKEVIQKFAEGAFGIGVLARIARGYTYISRNYENGDQISIVGFSRGAYTARALADMIASMGLLRPELVGGNDLARFDYAFAAWNRYRQQKPHGFLQDIADFFERVFEKRIMNRNVNLTDADFVNPGGVKIRAVGVWDTVGAMGIPLLDWHIPGTTVDVFRFADTDLSPNVENGIHAMSVDEKRPPFTPAFWNDRDGITQRLFSGAHSDVGGGYPEHGLANCALQWMVRKLKDCKAMAFDNDCLRQYSCNALDMSHSPWDKIGYQFMNPQPRNYPQNHQLQLDPCVDVRRTAAAVPVEDQPQQVKYQPSNIGGIPVVQP